MSVRVFPELHVSYPTGGEADEFSELFLSHSCPPPKEGVMLVGLDDVELWARALDLVGLPFLVDTAGYVVF
jgi:hypothetical protein